MDHLARRVGVSQPTVSHVLNGRAEQLRISRATQERIRKAARELGYRPNAAARSMARGRFGNVALLLSTDRGRSNLPGKLLDGIHDALAERDLHLTVVKLPDEKLTDAGFVPRILREWSCDGLLINYTDRIPAKMIELIKQSRHPAVWVNTKGEHDCVHPDDFGLGRKVAEHLIRLGHRRIAYVDFTVGRCEMDTVHYSRRDREAGHFAALREAGLTLRIIQDDEPIWLGDRACELCREVLSAPDAATAFTGYSPDHLGIVLFEAELAGRRVPEDLSLVGVGDSVCMAGGRRITTLPVPEREVGRAAVEMLVEKLAAPLEPLPSRAIPAARELEGETCGPPPPTDRPAATGG
jgi:DNA-binding LacI/PurR family transcriptional regulator